MCINVCIYIILYTVMYTYIYIYIYIVFICRERSALVALLLLLVKPLGDLVQLAPAVPLLFIAIVIIITIVYQY